MSRYLVVFMSFLLSACHQKGEKHLPKEKQEEVLFTNYTVQFPADEAIRLRKECQIETLENFFRLSYPDYRYLIDYQKSDLLHPLGDLYRAKKSQEYPPTLLSLTDVSDTLSIAKIGFFYTTESGFASLSIIYNLMIVEENGTFKLTNMLRYNTRDWQQKTAGKIEYRAAPDYEFDEKQIEKMQNFNKQIADFFHTNPLSFTYYLSPSVKKSMQIRGYDFQYSMFLSDQIGGMAFTPDKIIFAGNNSEYYPHELVHLYLYEHFPYAHRIVEEGLATYLGGSKGWHFKKHLQVLKKHLEENKIDLLDKLFNERFYTISEKTTLWYSTGALLCDLSLKKCGRPGLMKLLDAGKKDRELVIALEEVFGIEMENFNDFIRQELENY